MKCEEKRKMLSRVATNLSRREFLCRSCNGIGALALAGMLAEDLGADTPLLNPLAPKPQHLPRKAKHCIFMFMAGGASQIDTFDYKPNLKSTQISVYPCCRDSPGRSKGSSKLPIAPFPAPGTSNNMDNRGDISRRFSLILGSVPMTWPLFSASKWITTITDRRRCTSIQDRRCREVHPLDLGSATGWEVQTRTCPPM